MDSHKNTIRLSERLSNHLDLLVLLSAFLLAISATIYCYLHGYLILYGDAESHLNIAKRVISSLTPGFSQLGGIWLPLPHLMMVPFVALDFLWRTGLAGSIVSGFCYMISGFTLYKLAYLITKKRGASFIAFLIFSLNPNILYMQTTAMTELPLIMFMVLSIYFFIKFLLNTDSFLSLIFTAFFTFCATLSRYDGWILVMFETGILGLFWIVKRRNREEWMGKILMFFSLSVFGILLWLLWDYLILGDPLYFSNSPFSAKSQQQGWLMKGELPTYHNAVLSFLYYLVTSVDNIGIFIAVLAVIGALTFLLYHLKKRTFFLLLLLFSPFLFYVLTLFVGQSVIFTPELVPSSFEWKLFNVRYGLMMVPFAAFFSGYYFSKLKIFFKPLFLLVLLLQLLWYPLKMARVVTFDDGKYGLSASKPIDPEHFLATHYNGGKILLDDYARTVSIIRSDLPMNQIIYVGTKPYWDQSLIAPEKYATWIVMQKNDSVWQNIYENETTRARLYKYFTKIYTSPNILIFKRNTSVASISSFRG